MRFIILITSILFSTFSFCQQTVITPKGDEITYRPIKKVDSTATVKLLSLNDLREITFSLKDKMTVTEWEKVTQAIDKVYTARKDEYLKSKDTAKAKKPE